MQKRVKRREESVIRTFDLEAKWRGAILNISVVGVDVDNDVSVETLSTVVIEVWNDFYILAKKSTLIGN